MPILASLSYFGLREDYEEWNPSCIEAARWLDRTAPANARVAVSDEGDPSCIYYSGRKGWHFWRPYTVSV
jgi:hypothetical protein